jgi:hypothetical protein
MSCQTSVAAVFVHALVFYLALMFLPYIPILNRLDGFQNNQEGSHRQRGAVSGAAAAVGGVLGAAGEGVSSITHGVQKNIGDIAGGLQRLGI